MDEEKRDGAFDRTLLMNEVYVESPELRRFDRASEHGQLVDLGFAPPPVIAVLPPSDEPGQVLERGSSFPFKSRDLVRETGKLKPVMQVSQSRIRD
jgi:hypothetical protein